MRGDGAAVAELWQLHRRWVAAVLLAHKPSFEDLDDLLQEVAMTMVGKIGTLREEKNLRAWLRTVAINAARVAGRSGKYRPQPESSSLPLTETAGARLERDSGADEHVKRMLRRVEQLPDSYREPLLLRVVRGMRSRQIADVLGVPPATVDTRIARARRMLREADADEDNVIRRPRTERAGGQDRRVDSVMR